MLGLKLNHVSKRGPWDHCMMVSPHKELAERSFDYSAVVRLSMMLKKILLTWNAMMLMWRPCNQLVWSYWLLDKHSICRWLKRPTLMLWTYMKVLVTTVLKCTFIVMKSPNMEIRNFLCILPTILCILYIPRIMQTVRVCHYNGVIMGAMAYQITNFTIVYSTVYPGVDQRKIKAPRHWPLCGEFTGPVTRKMFPFDDVIVLVFCCCWLIA